MRIFFNHHISSLRDTLIQISDLDVHCAASHKRNDSPIKHVVDDFVLEPDLSGEDPEYVRWVLDQAIAFEADTMIPYRAREALANHKPLFDASGIRLITAADVSGLRLIEHKPSLLALADRLGLRTSPFVTCKGADEFRRLADNSFPGAQLCIKPAIGIYGSGFRKLSLDVSDTHAALIQGKSVATVSQFAMALEDQNDKTEWMLMPFLPGRERSVDFACLDGRLLGCVTRVKSATHQLVCHDPIAEDMAETLARNLKLSGVLNLQTLEDSNGIQYLLELNSRTSGGIGIASMSNVNLPKLFISALMGHDTGLPERVLRNRRIAKASTYEAV